MPRTTLAIEAPLLRELKLRAAQRGTTLQRLANELLRHALHAPPARFRLKLQGWDGVQDPSLDLSDRDALFAWMEEHPSDRA